MLLKILLVLSGAIGTLVAVAIYACVVVGSRADKLNEQIDVVREPQEPEFKACGWDE